MKQKLTTIISKAFSWIGVVAVLLSIFLFWTLFFKSQVPDGGKKLLTIACQGEKRSEQHSDNFTVLYRQSGCGQITSLKEVGQISAWAEQADSLLQELQLPPLRSGTVIDLYPTSKALIFAKPGSPGAIRMSPDGDSRQVRYTLDSALASLSLAEAAPTLNARKRNRLAAALVLASKEYDSARFRLLVPQSLLHLAERITPASVQKEVK